MPDESSCSNASPSPYPERCPSLTLRVGDEIRRRWTTSLGAGFLRARGALGSSIDFGQGQLNARQHKLASFVDDAQHAVIARDVTHSVAIAIGFVGNLPGQFARMPVDNSLP